MKKLVKTLIVAVSVMGLLSACTDAKEKAASKYMQEELGIEKEIADKIAADLNDAGALDSSSATDSLEDVQEETKPSIEVDVLPEIKTGKIEDMKVQIADMIFKIDMSMTSDDVKKIIESSSFDLTYDEKFDKSGFPVIDSVIYDGEVLCTFEWETVTEGTVGMSGWCFFKEEGSYLTNIKTDKVAYLAGGFDFDEINDVDEILTYLSNNNYTEIGEGEGTYNFWIQYKDGEITDHSVELLERVNKNCYEIKGKESIKIYTYIPLTDVKETVNSDISRAENQRVACFVTYVTFNTDGSIDKVSPGSASLKSNYVKWMQGDVIYQYL